MYGNTAGVQNYIRGITTLTDTSRPSIGDVDEELASESAVIDMHLAAAGYAVPVTAAASLAILNGCANLLVSATVYEQVAAGRDPNVLDKAQMWRDRADKTLQAVYSGDAVLPDAERATGTAAAGNVSSSVPSVTCAAPAFPVENTAEFASAHGANFGRA